MSVDKETPFFEVNSSLPYHASEKATAEIDCYERLTDVAVSIAALHRLEATRSEAKTVYGPFSLKLHRIIVRDIVRQEAYLGCGYNNIGLLEAEVRQLSQIQS